MAEFKAVGTRVLARAVAEFGGGARLVGLSLQAGLVVGVGVVGRGGAVFGGLKRFGGRRFERQRPCFFALRASRLAVTRIASSRCCGVASRSICASLTDGLNKAFLECGVVLGIGQAGIQVGT